MRESCVAPACNSLALATAKSPSAARERNAVICPRGDFNGDFNSDFNGDFGVFQANAKARTCVDISSIFSLSVATVCLWLSWGVELGCVNISMGVCVCVCVRACFICLYVSLCVCACVYVSTCMCTCAYFYV